VPAVTENYERQLWEDLTSRLAEVVSNGASKQATEDAILCAILGRDAEIRSIYERVRRLVRDGGASYLSEKWEEDNPVSRVRRRLYGRRA
jgi:hypothetical protein